MNKKLNIQRFAPDGTTIPNIRIIWDDDGYSWKRPSRISGTYIRSTYNDTLRLKFIITEDDNTADKTYTEWDPQPTQWNIALEELSTGIFSEQEIAEIQLNHIDNYFYSISYDQITNGALDGKDYITITMTYYLKNIKLEDFPYNSVRKIIEDSNVKCYEPDLLEKGSFAPPLLLSAYPADDFFLTITENRTESNVPGEKTTEDGFIYNSETCEFTSAVPNGYTGIISISLNGAAIAQSLNEEDNFILRNLGIKYDILEDSDSVEISLNGVLLKTIYGKENGTFLLGDLLLDRGHVDVNGVEFYDYTIDITYSKNSNSANGLTFSIGQVQESGLFFRGYTQDKKMNTGLYSPLSFYFRGDVQNNYLKFANKYWRVLGVNDDLSIRIIYEGETPVENGIEKNKGIGTSLYGNELTFQYSDGTNSTIADFLNNWYDNILAKYSHYISKDSIYLDLMESFSTEITDYKSWDDFSVNATYSMRNEKGTQSLTRPIGLINTYEFLGSGGSSVDNPKAFLSTSSTFWLMSSLKDRSDQLYYMACANNSSTSSLLSSNNSYEVRPVIDLKPNVVLEGYGSIDNPYEVVDINFINTGSIKYKNNNQWNKIFYVAKEQVPYKGGNIAGPLKWTTAKKAADCIDDKTLYFVFEKTLTSPMTVSISGGGSTQGSNISGGVGSSSLQIENGEHQSSYSFSVSMSGWGHDTTNEVTLYPEQSLKVGAYIGYGQYEKKDEQVRITATLYVDKESFKIDKTVNGEEGRGQLYYFPTTNENGVELTAELLCRANYISFNTDALSLEG